MPWLPSMNLCCMSTKPFSMSYVLINVTVSGIRAIILSLQSSIITLNKFLASYRNMQNYN